MSQDKDREQLIRELEALGELIGHPNAPTAGNAEPEADRSKSNHASLAPASPNNSDPETVDMFSVGAADPAEPELAELLRLPDGGELEVSDNDREHRSDAPQSSEVSNDTGAATQARHEVVADSAAYLDELVDELVHAVEKRLSLHSGESLPDPLREALAADIRSRLAPWWSDH